MFRKQYKLAFECEWWEEQGLWTQPQLEPCSVP